MRLRVAAETSLHLQESYPLAGRVRSGCLCFVEHALLCKVMCKRSSAAPLEVRRASAYKMMLPSWESRLGLSSHSIRHSA